MIIEIGAPACLPLGLVRLDDDAPAKPGWLGLTTQHPPVHLFAQAGDQLSVTGARADVGYRQAHRFSKYHRLPQQAQVEIELAIPAFVGLGSEAMLGLSLAAALAQLHGLPADQRQPAALARALGLDAVHLLEIQSFAQGGLLLVDAGPDEDGRPQVRRRAEIDHPEHRAWAFVFFFPRLPDDTPETLERERRQTALQAAPYLSIEPCRTVVEALWQAIAQDDIAAFGQALQSLQALNHAALAQAGTPLTSAPAQQAVLDLMRDQGALAWGQSLSGFCYYGLVEGAKASIELRTALRRQLGPFGGQVMATVTANSGMRQMEQPGDLNLNKYKPIAPAGE